MSRNSYLCDAHSTEAHLFCLCESSPLFLCPACLPKHESHDIYPIAQCELFQAIGKDKAELKRRNVLSQKCQGFFAKVVEREAAVQTQAKALMKTVSQNYDLWLEGNHHCFTSLLTTLREETDMLLTRAKYRLSSISQKVLEMVEALNSDWEKRFANIPEIEALKNLSERCQEANSRGSKAWQDDYEEEVLQVLTTPAGGNKRKRSPSATDEETVLLNLRLEETTSQLQALQAEIQKQTQNCLSLEKDRETLSQSLQEVQKKIGEALNQVAESNKKNSILETRLKSWGITSDPPRESQEPIPDYSTPASRAALARLGPYSNQDGELLLIKRGPVVEETGVYIGQWNTRNEKHGYGKFLYKTGDIYEGQWRNNKDNGCCRYIMKSGSVYVGNIVQSRIEGLGIMYYANGDEYSGAFVNNMKHGMGTIKFATASPGDRYIGEFVEGQQNGIGAKFWADGKMYVGPWKAGTMYGKGLMAGPNGEIYFGRYDETGRSGLGRCIWPNGDVYKGEYKRGMRSGPGRLTHPGAFDEGVWVEDVIGKNAENKK